MSNISSNNILNSLSIINKELKKDNLLFHNRKLIKNINFELFSLAAFYKAKENSVLISFQLLLKSYRSKPIKIFSRRSLSVKSQILKSIFQ
jgi:hypothetical protein